MSVCCRLGAWIGEGADDGLRSIAVQTMTSLTGVNVIQVCLD